MKATITLDGRIFDCATELMNRLSITPNTLARWRKKNLLPEPVKLGHFRYYERSEYERRLAEGE